MAMRFFQFTSAVLILSFFLLPHCTAEYIESSDDAQAIFDLIRETSGRFEDAGLVTVFDRIHTEYRDTGAAVTEEEVLLHFRDAAESTDYRSLHYEYNPSTANIEFLEVKIYRADGETVVTIDPSQILIRKAPADSIFWNFDSVICPVPRLEDGDALYYKTKRQGLNLAYLHEVSEEDFKYIPPQEGYFMDTLFFQERHPVIEKSYDITGPKDKPLQFAMANGRLNTSVRFSEADWHYAFSAEDIEPWSPEPFDDGYEETALKLALASHPSWEMKSKWAYEHNEPQFIISDAMRKKTQEIIDGCPDDACRMARLLHWVAEEIRYLGLDMGEGEGHMVHPTDEIFDERIGVCKDKAAILVSMLRAAGFESYFVMTLAMERTLDIPADDKFNHGVVAVRNDDGTWTFLDPTWAPQNRPLFNYLEQEQPVLVAAPEGVDLKSVPYAPPENSPMIIHAETALFLDGHAETAMHIKTDGYIDGRFRDALYWLTPDERDWYFQTFVEDLSPRAEILEYSFSDPLDFEQGIRITLRVRIPDAARKIGDELVFTPLLTRHIWNSRWQSDYLHAASGPETRQHGLELSCTRHIEFHENIRYPGGYSMAEPIEPVTIEGDTISGSFAVDAERRNQLKVDQVIRIKRRVTPPDEYPAVRKAVETLNSIRETRVVLKPDGRTMKNPARPDFSEEIPSMADAVPDTGARIHEKSLELTYDRGTLTERFIQNVSVFNERGRSEFADNAFIVNTRNQTLDVIESYTLTPDGSRMDTPERAINTCMDETGIASPDFADLNSVTVSHLGVEYGSRLVSVVERKTRFTETDCGANTEYFFSPQQEYPVETCRFVVRVPMGIELLYEAFDVGTAPEVVSENGWTTYQWRFDNLEAAAPERYSGGYFSRQPLILTSLSTAGAWDKRAAELEQLLFKTSHVPDESGDDPVAAAAASLTEDAHTGLDRIAALTGFVSGHIQTVSQSPRRVAWQLRSPARILESGYGLPLEQAVLLAALVEKAGGRCAIGLAGPDDRLSRTVPSASIMSDIYVDIRLNGDREQYRIDGRVLQPMHQIGRRILWIERDRHHWEESLRSHPESDAVQLDLDLSLNGEGSVEGTLDIGWAGAWNPGADAHENTDKWVSSVISTYVSKPEVTGMNIHSLSPGSGITRIRVTFKGTLVPEPLTGHLKTLGLPPCPGGLATDAYRLPAKDTREKPLVLDRCGRQEETIRLTWPDTLEPAWAPDPVMLEGENCRFRRELSIENHTLTFHRLVELERRIIPVEEYDTFVRIHQLLTLDEDNVIILKEAETR